MNSQLSQFLSHLEKLSPGSLITDKKVLQEYEQATFATEQRIIGVFKANQTSEVSQCLKLAQKFAISIYPISRGKNWGYGSRVPVKTDSLILDLENLKKIDHLNINEGYIRVGAGVSYRELYNYLLQKTQGKLWIDATGASPEGSIVGNIMERGHGVTPYGDHIATACRYEVVLPTGQIIHTGMGAFPGAATEDLDFWGLGPNITGLFSQSNLGVVTGLTLWLMKKPEALEVARIQFLNLRQLTDTIEELSPLKESGLIKAIPQFGNDYFFLSRKTRYPFSRLESQGFLDRKSMDSLTSELNISPWSSLIGLYGTTEEVEMQKRSLSQVFDKQKVIYTFHSERAGNQEQENVKIPFEQFSGGLGGIGLSRMYWRKKRGSRSFDPQKVNPEKDKCGVLTLPCQFSTRSNAIESVINTICDTFYSYSFEPNISMVLTRARIVQSHSFLCYDRDVPGEDKKALACQEALNRQFRKRRLYPHRLGINNMELMQDQSPETLSILQTIKRTLDPNNILAPGRYIPDI